MRKLVSIISIIIVGINSTNLYAQTDTWKQKSDLGSLPRARPVSFSIGNKGYVGTGSDGNYKKDFWEYDPSTNVWTQKADFGGTGRYSAFGFAINSKGYIGLGQDGFNSYKKDFWEYDPSLNTWSKKADFAGTARYGGLCFAVGNKGYVGLGQDANERPIDFWEYDPNTDQWTEKASFPGLQRLEVASFTIGIMGYACTGYERFNANRELWQYNTTTNGWTQKAYFPGASRSGAVGFAIGSKGYVGGGFSSSTTKDFYEYNSVTNAWTRIDDAGNNESTDGTAFTIGNYGYVYIGYYGGPGYRGNSNRFFEYGPQISTVINWVGNVNTDFNTMGNWDLNTLPTKIDKVIILPGTNTPVINSNVLINSLTVSSGAFLQIDPSMTLSVTGSFVNLGSICNNGGTILGSITGNAIANSVNPTVGLTVLPASTVTALNVVTFNATVTNINGGVVNYGFLTNGILQQYGTVSSFATSTLTNFSTVNAFISVSGGTCLSKNTATSTGILITVNKLPQTINLSLPSTVNFGIPPLTLTGTSNAGLPITYQSSNSSLVSVINNNQLRILGAGTVTITSFQSGNNYYLAVPSIPLSFTVLKADQSINFTTLTSKNIGDPSFKLTSTASSGLVVSYTSSNLAVVSISGNTVYVIGSGTATITGNQSGNVNYNPASPVSQTIVVSLATDIEEKTMDELCIYPNPAKGTIYLDGLPQGSKITLINILGLEVKSKEASGNTSIDVSSIQTGEYLLKISTPSKTLLKRCIVE